MFHVTRPTCERAPSAPSSADIAMEELSAYEQARLEKIAENKRMLIALGIEKVVAKSR